MIARVLALALVALLIGEPAFATSIGKWNTPSGVTTILSTELNALNSATTSASSSTVNNASNLNLYCDAEVKLGSLSPATGAFVTVYILVALDGTNFPSPTGSVLRNQSQHVWFTAGLDTTASTAQTNVVRTVLLPPEAVAFVLDNQSGVQLAATGNTLKINCYNFNLNG